MQWKIIFICAFIFLLVKFATAQKHEKEDTLTDKIIKALSTNDSAAYRALYPDFEQYKQLMQEMLKAQMADLTQEKVDGFLKDFQKESDSTFYAEFENLLQQAKDAGVDWKHISNADMESVAAYPENFPHKYLNGDIYFTSNQKQFVIEGIEAVELSGVYKLQSIKGIHLK